MKAQLLLADIFRKSFGQVQRSSLEPQVIQSLTDRSHDSTTNYQTESQLGWLRAASAMALSLDAMQKCGQDNLANRSSDNENETLQLCLDQAMLNRLRE